MIRIAEDTPEKLIQLFKDIDVSKVDKKDHDVIIDQLKKVAGPYIPRRKGKVKAIEIDLPGCPQRLATVCSQFDFNALSSAKRMAGLSFMRSWLKRNGFLK